MEAVLRAAVDADAVVIPFGGGTSISGSLEAPPDETRTVISVDLGAMDRVLAVDAGSRLARVQAGVLGPAFEAQLNARGWTLGHFPDSFTHSTLGGWSRPLFVACVRQYATFADLRARRVPRRRGC